MQSQGPGSLVPLGIGLVIVAGGIGFPLARWFAAPLTDLATAARDLGAGTLAVTLPRYKVPEAQEVAPALKTSGASWRRRSPARARYGGAHVARFAHSGHRGPPGLEDVALSSDPSPETAVIPNRTNAELDRLSDAVSDLLETARDLVDGEIDLDALVSDTIARLATPGKTFTHQTNGPLPTRPDPAPVVHALEALLVDGGSMTTADRATHLEISLTPAADADSSAAELIAATRGHLSRTDYRRAAEGPKAPLAGAPNPCRCSNHQTCRHCTRQTWAQVILQMWS